MAYFKIEIQTVSRVWKVKGKGWVFSFSDFKGVKCHAFL